MSYSVATYFDQESWAKNGLNWLRNATSVNLSGYVVGKDLNQQSIDKITELDFVHLPVINKFKKDNNVFFTLLQILQKNQRCLWVQNDIVPKSELKGDTDLICGSSQLELSSLVLPVVNLYDRAAMIESLRESIQKKHGKLLSSKYMLGTYDFWNGFVGCRAYLLEKEYLQQHDNSDDLVLNFFIVFTNSTSIEIKDYS
jgi:hypothetical protein